jgi:hypothetical protein
MAVPAQLHQVHPNGRRYTEGDKDAVYLVWKTAAGRSRRKTAELTGVSANTVDGWAKDGDWVGRARREDAEDARSLNEALRGVVATHALRSIEVAAKLRDDESGKTPAKTRLEAAIWLAAVAGIAPVKQSVDLTRREAPARDEAPAPVAKDPAARQARVLRARGVVSWATARSEPTAVVAR